MEQVIFRGGKIHLALQAKLSIRDGLTRAKYAGLIRNKSASGPVI